MKANLFKPLPKFKPVHLLNRVKKIIPPSFKRQGKLTQRYTLDLITGKLGKFVNSPRLSPGKLELFESQISIRQVIPNNSYLENRKHNLATAIACIENIPIQPGQIFSFWHLVGEPSQQKGYLESRAIVNNQLKYDLGGGLCQLPGLLYVLILKAGLNALEQHPHSKDIYTEETRFAPLGSDATVVYGYKDFRFQNTLSVPLCFRFTLLDEGIIAELCSTQPLEEFTIDFKVEQLPGGIKQVETLRYSQLTDSREKITTTIYPTLDPDAAVL
ncbi:VanW family protein [Ancylothrix sp. C2]|uniref:VanW family protein n=1 Tax=Ancylothrix sp. D3o TaxID=2953691 RepID=UPI0021BA4900|nr:VanW family protein [Ancylothrix sp. D3o]MCT7953462.1 VanW family protein [Ancylothrix sp. D3o]